MTGDFGVINTSYGATSSGRSVASSGHQLPQGLDRYRLEPTPNANQWRIVDTFTTATYARLTDTLHPAAVRLVAALNHYERLGH